jgi:hypothetical protein
MFTFESMITKEEKAVMYATVNGVTKCYCSWCGAEISVPNETPELCNNKFENLFQEKDTFLFGGKKYVQHSHWTVEAE